MSILTRPKAEPRPSTTTDDDTPAALGAPPKLRRRPVAWMTAIAAVLAGAFLSFWVWTSAGTTTEVLAVRTLVQRGEVINRDDLMVVRAGLDPAVQAVPASRLDEVAGRRAALDLAPNSLIAPDALAVTVLPAEGLSVVGVALSPGMLPAEPLQPGDAVRVVQTPGQQGEVSGVPVTVKATVVGVHPMATSDLTVVDVLVPASSAAELAARVATGKVAVVLDSRER